MGWRLRRRGNAAAAIGHRFLTCWSAQSSRVRCASTECFLDSMMSCPEPWMACALSGVRGEKCSPSPVFRLAESRHLLLSRPWQKMASSEPTVISTGTLTARVIGREKPTP